MVGLKVIGCKPPLKRPFPSYLLPSLSIPFRRHRASAIDRPNLPAVDNSPPQSPLSSSSSSSSESFDDPSSPATTHFTDCESFTQPDHDPVPPLPSPAGRRLSRTQPDTLRCRSCSADLAFGAQIVSKGFTGRHGRAYLVSAPSAMSTSPPFLHGGGSRPQASVTEDAADLTNTRVGRPENRSLVTGAHVVADIRCSQCDSRLGWKYVDAREESQKYKIGKFLLDTHRVVSTRTWEDVGGDGASDELFGYDRVRKGSIEKRAGSSSTPDREFYEAEKACREVGKGDEDDEEQYESGSNGRSSSLNEDDEGAIAFDSEDEDECEDIFSGTWDPHVVAQRRQSRAASLGNRA